MTEPIEKKLDVPIRDYDSDNYDEEIVVEVKEPGPWDDTEPKDLLNYFTRRFKEVHGYEYVVSWVKELAIMKAFQERYQQDAGPMIELLFDKYAGSLNGSVMTVTAFSRGSKWIQDRLYIELQQSKVKEETVKVEGLMDSSDFFRKISLGS